MVREGVDPELVSVINKRMELLGALTEPRSKRRLVEELDLSRSTVNRAVRQLETLGLVTRDGEYRLTVAGRLVVTVFEEFAADLDDVVRAEELLASLPPDAPIDVPMIRGAEVCRPTGPGPTGPVANALAALESAVRIRLLVPRISRPHTLDALETQVVDREVPATLVLSDHLVDHLREQERGWLDGLAAADDCDLWVAETLPYTLGVVRQRDGVHAGILVYDSDGTVEGFVGNDTLRAYAWAEGVFVDYRDDAVPLAAFEERGSAAGGDGE